MSGAGRTHRAKHLTEEFLDDSWDAELTPHQEVSIVHRVLDRRRVDVRFLFDDDAALPTTVVIPSSFHKVIWILRGDVVLVSGRATLDRKLSPKQVQLLSERQPRIAAAFLWHLEPKSAHPTSVHDGDADEEMVNPNAIRYRRMSNSSESEEDNESTHSQ